MCMCAQKGQSEEHGPSRPGVLASLQLWHQILLEGSWFTQSLLIHKMTPPIPKVLWKFCLLSLCQQSTSRCLCNILSWKGPGGWESACSTKEGRKEDESHSAQGSPMHFTTLICSLPISQYRWEHGKEQHKVIWTHQMEQEISLNCSWGIYLGCRFPWQDSAM